VDPSAHEPDIEAGTLHAKQDQALHGELQPDDEKIIVFVSCCQRQDAKNVIYYFSIVNKNNFLP
jgi:hypothetical protein